MLQVYSLTPLGTQLARSTNAPDNANYKVIFWLDKVHRATSEQLSFRTGLSKGDLAVALRRLRHSKVIQEETGVTA